MLRSLNVKISPHRANAKVVAKLRLKDDVCDPQSLLCFSRGSIAQAPELP